MSLVVREFVASVVEVVDLQVVVLLLSTCAPLGVRKSGKGYPP